ncbi:unnamed protein product [Phyllotreta striolata]|uniref:Uncharacterized protein n=1 Tax=Phyllotreta striolata TaxID=444603 RepID=A0A9N9TRY0_PHYSR|nr:unnamed protein product [Phyllotreta striolata]
METIVLALDLEKICRVCLLQSDSMFSIYSQLFDNITEEKMPTISNILISISNMKIREYDNLPTMICTRCINSAHIAYKFQQQCNTSQTILESYLEQIKMNSPIRTPNTVDDLSHSIVDDLSHNIVDDISQNIVDDLSQNIVDDLSQNIVDDLSQNIVDDLSQNVVDDLSHNIIDDLSHNIVDDLSASSIKLESDELNDTQYYNSSETDLLLDDKEDLLAEGLEYIANDCMINEEKKVFEQSLIDEEERDNDDCDDLKSCIPLGEETVDDLIDNFSVENLELISPKLDFNLNVRRSGPSLIPPPDPPRVPARIKKCPSMDYYKKNENDAILYGCNQCDQSFSTPNDLRIHFKTHDEKRPYSCTDCKKTFKTYAHLLFHIRRHAEKKIFECKECGKKYKQSGTLTAHMRIHTGSKPYLCSVCGRGFRQAPDLTYHMRTHTKEKPYMCSICGKTMSMQCHLVQHMRSHTGEKPFKCPKCDKAFPSSTRLKRHSIVHTALKPYKCTVCEKSFNRSSSLKVHNRTHTGVKSYKCPTCNKSFLWAHSLRSHAVTHIKNSKEDLNDMNELLEVNDNSLLKFTTMTIYSDEKTPINESFAIFSSGDLESGSKSFQICAVSTGEQTEGVETFTLYSADETGQVKGSVNSIQLSNVSM